MKELFYHRYTKKYQVGHILNSLMFLSITSLFAFLWILETDMSFYTIIFLTSFLAWVFWIEFKHIAFNIGSIKHFNDGLIVIGFGLHGTLWEKQFKLDNLKITLANQHMLTAKKQLRLCSEGLIKFSYELNENKNISSVDLKKLYEDMTFIQKIK